MARGINKVILLGHLGRDPEVKYMPNGNAVANITIAGKIKIQDNSKIVLNGIVLFFSERLRKLQANI